MINLEKQNRIIEKENLQKLGAEAVLSNAAIIKFVEDKIFEDPEINFNSLFTLIKKNFKIYFELDKIEKAVKGVLSHRDKMKKIYNLIEANCIKNRCSFEEEVKKYLNNGKNKKIKNPIKVHKNPLAIVIITNNREDMAVIYGSADIPGGFYDETFKIYNNEESTINLIGILEEHQTNKNITDNQVYIHELQHFINEILSHQFGEMDLKKNIWSRGVNDLSEFDKPINEDINELHKFNKNVFFHKFMLKLYGANYKKYLSEKIKGTTSYQMILDRLLGLAKDEIIAETDINAKDKEKHITFLLNHIDNENYDYYEYAEKMGIKRGTPLFELVSNEYKKLLLENTNEVFEMLAKYELFLPKRAKYFKYVLIQWPLQDWKRNINKYGFKEEMNQLKKLEKAIDNLSKAKKIKLRAAWQYFKQSYSSILEKQQDVLLTSEITILVNKINNISTNPKIIVAN